MFTPYAGLLTVLSFIIDFLSTVCSFLFVVFVCCYSIAEPSAFLAQIIALYMLLRFSHFISIYLRQFSQEMTEATDASSQGVNGMCSRTEVY